MEFEQPSSKFTLSPSISIIIAGVIIAGAVIFASRQPAPQAAAVAIGQQPASVAVDATKVSTSGDPILGNPNAPVTIAYWYDYSVLSVIKTKRKPCRSLSLST